MEFLHTEIQDKIGIVRLNRGITNPLNLELVTKLTKILQGLKQEPDVQGVVLTDFNEKFFSIGFDIPQLIGLTKKDFKVFYRSFNRLCILLYTLPMPTIAAITGHAVAGGCILTLCCDYRFIAQGRKLMGLNEIKLGVPVPYPAACILPQIVGTRNARTILDTGDFYPPEKSLQLGMVDAVLPIDQVLPHAIEKIRLLDTLSLEAFRMSKQNRCEIVEAQILSNLKQKEQIFIKRWYSDKTRERVKKAIEKF